MHLLLKIVSMFFCILPKGAALFIGKSIGYLFFLFSHKKRGQALKNLRLAFPKKPYRKLVEITKVSFQELGMSIIESLRIPKEDKRIIGGPFVVENDSYLSSIEKDRGIFCSIHMGSWELFNISFANYLPYLVLARRQPDASFDAYLNTQRRSQGLKVVYEDDIRSLIGYMKKEYILGIVFDHGSRDSKIYSKFFGKLIPVPVGPMKLALKFKRKLYPACLTRLKANAHLFKIFAPVDVRDEKDFRQVADYLNRCYEEFLRKRPQGYLWWYKRFKRSKNLHILVLSDARIGHLRQSLSLAKLIEEKRPGSSIETVEIKLSRIKRLVFDIATFLSSERCRLRVAGLRTYLGKDFDRLFRYADIVISCGASLSSLNRMLSYAIDAKSFVIQKPNVSLYKHDLVILPFHDKVAGRKNVVKTSGSLTLYEAEKLKSSSDRLRTLCNEFSDKRPKIGVFIGGPLKSARSLKEAKEALSLLKEASCKNKWQLFVTTSRRTPKVIEDFLKKEFDDMPLLIIANKKNFPFVASGILGLCDLILVSSDSISMITESASAKPTLVYDIFAHTSPKHSSFVANLTRLHYAKYLDKRDIEQTIQKVLDKDIVLERIDNRAIIDKVLEKKL